MKDNFTPWISKFKTKKLASGELANFLLDNKIDQEINTREELETFLVDHKANKELLETFNFMWVLYESDN